MGVRRATWRVAVGLSALLGCRESTHVVLDLTTDVPCAELRATTIAVGTAGEVESAPATTSTDRCEGTVIGDLVLVPSDSTEEKFAVRVVAGVGISPEDCVANGYQGGCIVGRRLLRFVPHTELRLPVALTLDCLDVPCSEVETCVAGNCVSAEIPDSTLCAESGGCILGGGAAGAGAAGGAGVGGAAGAGGAGGAPGGGGPGASGGGGSGSGGEPASGGSGGMLACDPPTTGDCNSNANDGCETELTTSAAHCGACDHDCLGGECELGVCQAFALVPGGTDQPSFVGADEQHVYWGHWASSGAVRRLPLSGGGVSDFALDQSYVRAIVLDATHVYWTTALASGAVMKRPKDLSAVATAIVQVNTPRELAVDGSRVFYTAGSGNTGLVGSALLGGGGGTTLAANNFPWGIAVDATNAYFDANFNMGDVFQAAKGGGQAPTVLGTGKFPYSMAVDATHVYFVDTVGVFKLSLAAGVLEKLADAGNARSMTIDDTHVYWTESVANGSVRKVAKSGAPVSTLATGQASPRGIAVNEKAIFWGNDVPGGAVMMVAK
jgi:hypothetical protein